ncbi:UNVERIFIED_CONTAM: hypothetical protein K2H54_037061 [Gekko kuhli]
MRSETSMRATGGPEIWEFTCHTSSSHKGKDYGDRSIPVAPGLLFIRRHGDANCTRLNSSTSKDRGPLPSRGPPSSRSSPFDGAGAWAGSTTGVGSLGPSTRLRPYARVWEEITTNHWVLTIIRMGYAIEFDSSPQIPHVRSLSSTLCKDDNHLQNFLLGQCYNFICINDTLSDFQKTQQLVEMLGNMNASVLYSIVLISVHLNNLEDTSCSSEMPKLVELAKEVNKTNIFLYGLIVHYQQLSHFESELELQRQDEHTVEILDK